MFGRDYFAPESEIISPKVKVEKSSSVKPSPNPLPEGEGNEKTLAEQTLDSPTMLVLSQRERLGDDLTFQ